MERFISSIYMCIYIYIKRERALTKEKIEEGDVTDIKIYEWH